MNSVTGEPVPRALVQIFVGDEHATLTDSRGGFQFEGLPAGQTSISVRKPGFFTEQEIAGGRIAAPNVRIGPSAEPVSLKLIPGGAVFGRISNSDGEPIEDLPVRLHHLRLLDGYKRWEQSREARTDENGSFRIGNLLPGSYYVTVGPRREDFMALSVGRPTPARGYPQMFYPAGKDLASASPLAVASGQQVQADMLSRMENFYEVSGVVSGYPPNSGVDVVLSTQSGEAVHVGTRMNFGTGQFSARVPAGTYMVHAASQDLAAWASLAVHSDVSGLQLVLRPTITIPVVTHVPAVNAQVLERTGQFGPFQRAQPVNVHLTAINTSLQNSEYYAVYITIDGHPAFVLRNVEPGTYSVEVTPSTPGYVQSVRCGDVDLLQEDLHITSETAEPIEVVLARDGATLNGTVAGIDLSAGSGIIVLPEHGSTRHLQTTYAGPDGHFQIGALAPGNYSVLAFDRLDSLEYRNPEVLSSYLSQATHVVLSPDTETKVNVNLIRLEK